MTTSDSLARAIRLHQAGKLAEAETLYRQILAQHPNEPDALHLLGVLAGQRGQNSNAIDLISRAIALNPSNASYNSNIAEMFRKSGKLDLALQHARRAVQLNPRLIEGLNILGVVLCESGNFTEAIQTYHRAIQIQPNNTAVHINLGNALVRANYLDQAIASYQRAVELSPNFSIAHFNLGNTLRAAGRLEWAIGAFRRSIELDPSVAEVHCNLGDALRENGQLDEALVAFQKAVQLKPNLAEIYCNLGITLAAQGKNAEAFAAYNRALEINPNYPEAFNNLGNLLAETGKVDEGIAAIRRAIQLKPDFAKAHYNLANALQEATRFDEAIAEHDIAIKLKPDYAHAHFNRALILLLQGRYADGWPGYDWRSRAQPMFFFNPENISKPRWRGKNLAGGTILLHAEQGFGDTIQAARYIRLIARQTNRIILLCQTELARLLKNLPDIIQIVTPGEPLPEFEVHCPLMSLPGIFSTTLASIPSQVPCLLPNPDDVALWKSKLSAFPAQPKVGLAWAGSKTHKLDGNRSLDPALLDLLADLPSIQWICLQKGDASKPQKLPLVDWTADLRDFADTAALIANLDLVISVDTAVAHLAGALGRKLWILLADPPDWRWLLDREDSPWYPTARLFRQKSRGDWNGVIQNLLTSLKTTFS